MSKHTSLLTLCIVLFFSCSSPSDSDTNVEVNTIALIRVDQEILRTFAPSEIQIKVVEVIKNPGVSTSVEWKSDNEEILEVDENGRVRVIGLGKANIIAGLYKESQILLATDTVLVYSEARRVYEGSGTFKTLTTKKDNDELLVSLSLSESPYHKLLISESFGNHWQESQVFNRNIEVLDLIRSEADQSLLALNYIDDNFSTNNGDIEASGILVSEDDGNSWRDVVYPFEETENEEFTGLQGIALSSSSRGLLYSLLRLRINDNWPDNEVWRLYKSDDLGNNWEKVEDFILNGVSHPKLLVDPNDGNVIYVSSSGQVDNGGGFVSTDGGITWNVWPKDQTESILHISSEGVLYGRDFDESTSGPEKIVYTKDYASSWEILLERSINEHGKTLKDVSTYQDIVGVLVWKFSTNAGSSIRISENNGNSWKEHFLSFNDRRTFADPQKVLIIDSTEEYIDFLVFWSGSGDFHITKSRFFRELYD